MTEAHLMDVFVSGMGRAADAPCASAAKSANGLTFCARASYNIQYRRGTEKYPLTPPQERERRRLKARPGRRGEKCIRELRCRPRCAGSGMDAVLRRRVGRVCAQTEWNRGPAVSEQETAGLLTYRKLREIPCDGH